MAEPVFPVSVQGLLELIPHRGTAVWIDEVISLSETGGRCRVYIKDAPYVTDSKVRHTSFIEFMAQSYAYVSAGHFVYSTKAFQKKISEAFLVGIRNFEILDSEPIKLGDTLEIEVTRSHQLGDITLINGIVFSAQEKAIAKGQIKLFAR